MATKLLLLLPLLAGSSLFLSGAWSLPSQRPEVFVDFPFVAHDPQPPAQDAPLEGERLLDQTLARFAPDKLKWLHVAIWQKMADAEVAFEAVGALHLAPNGCARLEMQVARKANHSKLLFVSDGHAYAQETRTGDAAPALQSDHAPKEDGDARRAFLLQRGCGGPWAQVKELRQRLSKLSVRHGRSNGLELIELRGELPAGNVPEALRTKPCADSCVVYLEAATLWPHRVEWRANAKRDRKSTRLNSSHG